MDGVESRSTTTTTSSPGRDRLPDQAPGTRASDQTRLGREHVGLSGPPARLNTVHLPPHLCRFPPDPEVGGGRFQGFFLFPMLPPGDMATMMPCRARVGSARGALAPLRQCRSADMPCVW